MLRNFALLAALVLAGFLISRLYEALPPVPPTAAQTDYRPAPDFEFQDRTGNSHSLAQYRGKVLLVNFWASWCVPCRVEFPQFIALAKARPDDVVIVAFSVDKDAAAMQKFLADFPQLPETGNIIIAPDAEMKISRDLFQTYRYPETILIAPDFTLRRKYLGIELAWDGPDFAKVVDALLGR